MGQEREAGVTAALVGAVQGRTPDRSTLVSGVVAANACAVRVIGARRLLVPPGEGDTTSVAGVRVEPVATIEETLTVILGR